MEWKPLRFSTPLCNSFVFRLNRSSRQLADSSASKDHAANRKRVIDRKSRLSRGVFCQSHDFAVSVMLMRKARCINCEVKNKNQRYRDKIRSVEILTKFRFAISRGRINENWGTYRYMFRIQRARNLFFLRNAVGVCSIWSMEHER